jgi:hypothetical protein
MITSNGRLRDIVFYSRCVVRVRASLFSFSRRKSEEMMEPDGRIFSTSYVPVPMKLLNKDLFDISSEQRISAEFTI